MKSKRVIIATLFGVVSGVGCFTGGNYLLGADLNMVEFFMILFHRTLLGFVIGISALPISWPLHGLLIGFVVGLPVYPLIYNEANLISYSVMGMIWGFVIEFFTSFVFKARVYNG